MKKRIYLAITFLFVMTLLYSCKAPEKCPAYTKKDTSGLKKGVEV